MTTRHRLLELASLGLLSGLLIVPALAQTPEKPSAPALAPEAGPGLGLADHALGTVGQALGSAGHAVGEAARQVTPRTPNQPDAKTAQTKMAKADEPDGAEVTAVDMQDQAIDSSDIPMTPNAKIAKAEPLPEESVSPGSADAALADMLFPFTSAGAAPMPPSPASGAPAIQALEESGQLQVSGPPVGHPVGVGAAGKR